MIWSDSLRMFSIITIRSVMATAQYRSEPGGACWPTAAAVMSETTATGPTASTRLVPSSAYTSKGATLAYSPTSGGNPASWA